MPSYSDQLCTTREFVNSNQDIMNYVLGECPLLPGRGGRPPLHRADNGRGGGSPLVTSHILHLDSVFHHFDHLPAGALAGASGSVASLQHWPRYCGHRSGTLGQLVIFITVMMMTMGAILMMTMGTALIKMMVQVASGEETALVLLNFLPKPVMVVYNAYTQSESVDFSFLLHLPW